MGNLRHVFALLVGDNLNGRFSLHHHIRRLVRRDRRCAVCRFCQWRGGLALLIRRNLRWQFCLGHHRCIFLGSGWRIADRGRGCLRFFALARRLCAFERLIGRSRNGWLCLGDHRRLFTRYDRCIRFRRLCLCFCFSHHQRRFDGANDHGFGRTQLAPVACLHQKTKDARRARRLNEQQRNEIAAAICLGLVDGGTVQQDCHLRKRLGEPGDHGVALAVHPNDVKTGRPHRGRRILGLLSRGLGAARLGRVRHLVRLGCRFFGRRVGIRQCGFDSAWLGRNCWRWFSTGGVGR